MYLIILVVLLFIFLELNTPYKYNFKSKFVILL